MAGSINNSIDTNVSVTVHALSANNNGLTCLVGEEGKRFLLWGRSDFMEENGVFIEAKKLGRNSRRIRSKVVIRASLDEVWRVLTDYERLAEFLPSLVACEILERNENFTRVKQVGRQNLAFGLKISSKITMDCYEREVELLESGRKRDMDFKMVESDFAEIFEGKWSLEQPNKQVAEDGNDDSSFNEGCETTLSYTVDVKPKLWLPIQLGVGMFMEEIKTGHNCLRDEVMRLVQNAQPSL